ALFTELTRVSALALDDDERVAVMIGWQRYEAHCVGQKLTAIARFAGPTPTAAGAGDTGAAAFAWTEIGAALRVGEGSARGLVADARQLTSHLPGTLTALLSGAITWPKTQTLLSASGSLSPEQCAVLEDRVLPDAARRTPALHARAVRRAVDKLDPDGAAARRDAKKRDIALIRYQQGDGVADLLARALDSLDAELIWTGADTWARQHKATGDPRTLDALRCAALVDWATRYLRGEHTDATPTRNGHPAVVDVIIGLPELVAGDGTGLLASTGEAVPADAIATLLDAGAKIRFALTDTDGNLVGVSTGLHDPPALMRAYLALRDLTARTPTGSTTPVAGQDLDHINPDGPTTPANLHAPTRGWHRAKTFRHWHIIANPDRTITWTSQRTGRSYTTHPFNYRDGP
ncbi:MAG TPA: DUF222 domain-containing protein, partial [Mycobacteriales bacterium]|nr:DUF222 domain-containing protein [Mycobacteriales bacterium]